MGISKKATMERMVSTATANEMYFMAFLENMSKILRENEELIKVVRKHTMFLLPVFFTWPLIIVGLFLVRYLLNFDLFGYWVWVSIAGILIVVFVMLQKCFIWKNDALIITNQRVIENEQTGVFSKTVTELLYKDILEISYSKQGMSASLYDFGDLKITTAADENMVLEKIANPDETVELINKLRQNEAPSKLIIEGEPTHV